MKTEYQVAPSQFVTSVTTVVPKKERAESQMDKATRELLRQLNAGHTENYRQMLEFHAKLWDYSLLNTYLIQRAKPDAEAVAGYARWQKLGRQVRQGAVGVNIFVPMFRKEKDEAGIEAQRLSGFRTGRVFSDKDLVDWDTNPLPSMWQKLPDDAHTLYDTLRNKVCNATGYTVREVELFYNGARGSCDYDRKRISILKSVDSRNKCLILLHEFAHSMFHVNVKGVSRKRKEFEAESLSFIVASVVGLTNPHSSDYLLNWDGSALELKSSMVTIQQMAREAIDKLDLRLHEEAA